MTLFPFCLFIMAHRKATLNVVDLEPEPELKLEESSDYETDLEGGLGVE